MFSLFFPPFLPVLVTLGVFWGEIWGQGVKVGFLGVGMLNWAKRVSKREVISDWKLRMEEFMFWTREINCMLNRIWSWADWLGKGWPGFN